MSDSHRRITEPRWQHVSDGMEDLPAEEPTAEQAAGVRGGELAAGAPGDAQLTDAVVSPRDAASGLPTGKRMHKPFTIT